MALYKEPTVVCLQICFGETLLQTTVWLLEAIDEMPKWPALEERELLKFLVTSNCGEHCYLETEAPWLSSPLKASLSNHCKQKQKQKSNRGIFHKLRTKIVNLVNSMGFTVFLCLQEIF